MSNVRFVNTEDGEEASYVDQNRVRDFTRALYGDMRLGSMFSKVDPGDFLNPYPNNNLYAHGLGGAPYASGTRQISNLGGLIHQYNSASVPDGATPVLLSYWLAGDELLSTLAVGDATNPRIDLIEIGLTLVDETESRDFKDSTGIESTNASTVTKKKVTLTKNVIQGTPSATPSIPSGTAGFFSPWCYVWVPPTFNSTFTDLEISDLRFPLGYKRIFVPAIQASTQSGEWLPSATPVLSRVSGGVGDNMWFACPILDASVRLLGVYIHADSSLAVTVNRMLVDAGTLIQLSSLAVATTIKPPLPGGSDVPSATQPMAWWCNGFGHAQATMYGSNGSFYIPHLAITSLAGGQNVYGVSFEFAGTV